MVSRKIVRIGLFTLAIVLAARLVVAADTPIDFAAYEKDCEVRIEAWNGNLRLSWPAGERDTAEVTLDLSGTEPLIQSLAIKKPGASAEPILTAVDPAWFLTVGERRASDEKSPEQKWEVFFDNPHKRPHETFASKLAIKKARVTGSGQRATVAIDDLTVGPFVGSVELSIYSGTPLIRIDAVLKTEKDRLAVYYDTGLVADQASWREIGWVDTEGGIQKQSARARVPAASSPGPFPQRETGQTLPQAVKVRHRAIAALSKNGAVTCFPSPHQFQFPRDYSTNLGFVWYGEDYQGQAGKIGFGIRQNKDGGGNFVPWFNAPPDATHRMGAFYLLHSGSASEALQETIKLTHDDRFVELPGYKTFSSHYHMAIAVKAMQERAKGIERREPPEYVGMFKNMGVNMVHLGEFHGDGNPKDPGPLRLPQMQSMFDECRRWSDDTLLLTPGEEANVHLGLTLPGKQAGHWMLYFPRPVYWTMVRSADQPFVEEISPYGKVYHVGDRGDMIRLIKEEQGLAWTAHPRIKGSAWTPDLFRHEDFFLADFWLGGAWKSMPGDLSREKLGERVLHLMDDMANWGQRKYVPGEVDVFTLDQTHELYAHMNVNYVKLDRVPRFDEGWKPILDVLRGGRFFVTTGEILIPTFTVGGKHSGDVAKQPASGELELKTDFQWTFPLAFAEIISGDGQQVFRDRIDLTDTSAFGNRSLSLTPQLKNRRWVRLEIWDIAANGAFTQPVWIE